MSNALLFARLLTEPASSKPVEATSRPGGGTASQYNSKTAPRASQGPISANDQLRQEYNAGSQKIDTPQEQANDQLRQEYNRLLTREKKAEEYLGGPDRTQEDIDKWLPEFNQICMDLSSILDQLGEYTHEEAVSGFTAKTQDSMTA